MLDKYIDQLKEIFGLKFSYSDFSTLNRTDQVTEEFYKKFKSNIQSGKKYKKASFVDFEIDVKKLTDRVKDEKGYLLTKNAEWFGAPMVPISIALSQCTKILELDGDSLNIISTDLEKGILLDYFEEFGEWYYELTAWGW